MRKTIKFSKLLIPVILAFLFINKRSFSQVKEFNGKDMGEAHSEYIGKYLKKYAVYKLDVSEIASCVKAQPQKAKFVLNLSSKQLNIEVEINDMRGKNFKAVAMTEHGSVELAQTFTNTYKGFENQDLNNIVRLTIDESTFEGYIHIGKKWLYFDMLHRFIPDANMDEVVIYDADDVIADNSKICSAEINRNERQRFLPQVNLTGNCHFAEIATEADYEYYQAFSNNADVALARIRSILNQVEGLYNFDYHVQFILTFQQIWANPADPYSGDSLEAILPQFRDFWNLNRIWVWRDVTHMFSGRTVLNSSIGYAYIGTVCNPITFYGCVLNYTPVNSTSVELSAHELGHNFGANHDTTCNGNNIMCPYNQGGATQWSAQSQTEITNYIAASIGCLTENFPPNLIINGNGANQNYLRAIASSTITLNSTGGQFQLDSNGGFGFVEAGGSIVLAPSNANSLGFYAPQGSNLHMRISDVANFCDVLPAKEGSDNSFEKENEKNFNLKNVPNPFSSSTEIIYILNEDCHIDLNIYNVQMQLIKTVYKNEMQSSGSHKIKFDANNLEPGIYFVIISDGKTNGFTKMVVTK